jgi:hypothetical protein
MGVTRKDDNRPAAKVLYDIQMALWDANMSKLSSMTRRKTAFTLGMDGSLSPKPKQTGSSLEN